MINRLRVYNRYFLHHYNKLLPEIGRLNFCDHLKTSNLPALHYRHIRSDIIEMHKYLVANMVWKQLGMLNDSQKFEYLIFLSFSFWQSQQSIIVIKV